MNWDRMAVSKLSDLRLSDIVAGRLLRKASEIAFLNDSDLPPVFPDWMQRRTGEAVVAHNGYGDDQDLYFADDSDIDTMELEDRVFGDGE